MVALGRQSSCDDLSLPVRARLLPNEDCLLNPILPPRWAWVQDPLAQKKKMRLILGDPNLLFRKVLCPSCKPYTSCHLNPTCQAQTLNPKPNVTAHLHGLGLLKLGFIGFWGFLSPNTSDLKASPTSKASPDPRADGPEIRLFLCEC